MIAPERKALRDRPWGVNRAADRVWAQIAGIAPSTRPWERLFVTLRAFIDESYDSSVFVLAGYVASVSSWESFASEWDELLPLYGRRNKRGRHYFKMSQIAAQMDKVSAFYHVIENHAIMAVSARLDLQDFDRAKHSISATSGLQWAIDPYSMTFRVLLDIFHNARASYPGHPVLFKPIPEGSTIDFYFDNHAPKGPILAAWDNYINSKPDDVKNLYGATPRFENDDEFLPLQAADFLAWWIRKGYSDNTLDDVGHCNIPEWHATKLIPNAHIWLTEDQICEALIGWVREKIGPHDQVRRTRFYLNGMRL